MTTYDSSMSHTYTSDNSFDDFNGMNAFKVASPHGTFSPTMGNQEFSALLDAFTNTSGGDDYSSSLFTGQQQNCAYFSSGSYDSFNPAWTMGTDSQPSSFGQTDSSYSPKSSIVSSGSSNQNGDGNYGRQLNSGQSNLGTFDATPSLYNPADSYSSSHRPNSQTVPFLEAIAAAPSTSMPMSSSQSQVEHMPFNPQSSNLARQDSTRSFLEGPHLSGLSLNSPRNSISAGSSTPSSSQNSPTTPLSAYSSDLNLSFHSQQQNYLAQSQQGGAMLHQQAANFIPYANGAHQNTQKYVAGNALSMSVPASFSSRSTPYDSVPRSQLQTSAKPHGRMSSAGLMDQIVSSRQVAVSPNPEKENMHPSLVPKEKKGVRSRASSKSKTTPTPPATPGRAGLRASKHGVDPTQLETILSGHTTPTGETAPRQTPSSAGPHRTPSKRTLSYESVPQQAITPAATTPRRPSTLRRTASHTPGSSSPHEYIAGGADGLASPANLQASQRAQNAAQFALASAMGHAQKARIAASANLEFPSGASSGSMSRAQSSPGYALTSSFSQQPNNNVAMASPGMSYNDQAKRRSNTISLQMSPLSTSTYGPSSASSSNSNVPVSFAEALLALDQMSSFLNHQATFISSHSNQTMDNVLGTYEQMQAIDDLKRRVQNSLSFTS
ncbi:hypothetical protein P389DRAFT_5995 [Cystobasidium minutum MCA 4210]|uniref:uncharacterized protein n=1 Tax=Cystobasidium minutum MCA 4210 TaxID=1397322 RepID=UPI0034CFED46|eukprot:jgi/Rhomi1/5995/CE5994_2152